jgi:hypothetical protein
MKQEADKVHLLRVLKLPKLKSKLLNHLAESAQMPSANLTNTKLKSSSSNLKPKLLKRLQAKIPNSMTNLKCSVPALQLMLNYLL